MLSRLSLLAGGCVLFAFSFAGAAEDKKVADDPSEVKVTLQLKTIEATKLVAHYGRLIEQEISLQGEVQYAMKSGDRRLPEFQQRLQGVQNDLEVTKKKLIELEAEKAKLRKRLGEKDATDAALDPTEKMNRTLEKILERLERIDKRLEQMEKRQR